MATKTITMKVCDVCESDKREAHTYTISKDGREVEKDLCSVHGRPIEVVLGNAKPAGRRPANGTTKKAASGRRGRRVTTTDDIAKDKEKAGANS